MDKLSVNDITEADIVKYKLSRESLDKARETKAMNIVTMLDLFGGQLSLNDVLYTELPILRQLEQAKIKYIGEVAKEREKKQRAAASGKQ